MQKSDMFWLGAFALGFFFSFAVGFVPAGIGLFLFLNAALYAIWKVAKRNPHANILEKTEASTSIVKIFMGIFVLFTLPYLYRYDPAIITALVIFHLIFLFLFVFLAVLPSTLHILDVFSIFIGPLSVGLTWIIEAFKSIVELFRGKSNVVKFMLKFILYAAISLAIFILFANLLSQADAEFQKRIQAVLESLKLSEVMGRTVLGVIFSFVAAGILTIIGYFNLLPLLGSSQERAKKQWETAFAIVMNKRSDTLLPLVITLPVVLLFALYVWVQTKYLFGVDIQEILGKYSFAEYARRGFAELLVVGILTYPVLAWTMNRAKTEWALPRVANFAINTGIVSLLVIMLYSLVFRMNLYMATYGPSVLRSYVIIGAVVVAVSLLAYEAVAVLKMLKPGYSFFRALLFGDYSVIGLFAVFAVLGSVALVPWSTVVARQLSARYVETKKVDVFQLLQLADEAQPVVYEIAQKLENDRIADGANILKVHALQVRDNYVKTRQGSLFTNIFGFNLAGMAIENISTQAAGSSLAKPPDVTKDVVKKANTELTARAKFIVDHYLQALIMNDFAKARTFYDPEMKHTDIAKFSDDVALGSVSVYEFEDGRDTYTGDFSPIIDAGYTYYEGSKYRTYTATAVISRGIRPVSASQQTPTTFVRKETITIQITLGIRNGALVIVDSNVPLAYLPDAIPQTQDADAYNVGLPSYGYALYCEVPNLRTLFNPSSRCANDYSTPAVKLNQIPFKESDFQTVAK